MKIYDEKAIEEQSNIDIEISKNVFWNLKDIVVIFGLVTLVEFLGGFLKGYLKGNIATDVLLWLDANLEYLNILAMLIIPIVYLNKKYKVNLNISKYFYNHSYFYLFASFLMAFLMILARILIFSKHNISCENIDYIGFFKYIVFSPMSYFRNIIAPISEEIFFVGIIYGFMIKKNIKFGLILQAVIFAAVHTQYYYQINYLLFLFCTFIVEGYFYKKTGSLLTPTIIHIIFNYGCYYKIIV